VDAEALRVARREISRRAGRTAKAYPVAYDDLVQEGWVVALEAWRSYDPARGAWGPFLGRALARGLRRAAAREISPVHLRGGHECALLVQGYGRRAACPFLGGRHSTRPAIADRISPYPSPEAVAARRELAAQAYAVLDSCDPPVGEGVRQGWGATDLAKAHGGTRRVWQTRIEHAYARARDEIKSRRDRGPIVD